MNWKEAIKRSPESTAVIRRGDYAYLKYPNGSVFKAKSDGYVIIEKASSNIDGNWEPLYDKRKIFLN